MFPSRGAPPRGVYPAMAPGSGISELRAIEAAEAAFGERSMAQHTSRAAAPQYQSRPPPLPPLRQSPATDAAPDMGVSQGAAKMLRSIIGEVPTEAALFDLLARYDGNVERAANAFFDGAIAAPGGSQRAPPAPTAYPIEPPALPAQLLDMLSLSSGAPDVVPSPTTNPSTLQIWNDINDASAAVPVALPPAQLQPPSDPLLDQLTVPTAAAGVPVQQAVPVRAIQPQPSIAMAMLQQQQQPAAPPRFPVHHPLGALPAVAGQPVQVSAQAQINADAHWPQVPYRQPQPVYGQQGFGGALTSFGPPATFAQTPNAPIAQKPALTQPPAFTQQIGCAGASTCRPLCGARPLTCPPV